MQEFVKKLIERLEEETELTRETQTIECRGNDGYGTPLQAKLSGEICALLKAIKIVNQLAEEYNNGWISVNERLPENNRAVLVYTNAGEIDVDYYGAYLKDFIGLKGTSQKAIAWRELPAPYQPKGE